MYVRLAYGKKSIKFFWICVVFEVYSSLEMRASFSCWALMKASLKRLASRGRRLAKYHLKARERDELTFRVSETNSKSLSLRFALTNVR